MSKTIIFDADARNRLKVGVDTLANSVKVTMGPGGRNVVIARDGGLAVTKDGVSVAREVVLSDHIADVGAQMVKQVAHKVAQLAGDGTTTATVLTQEIFNRGLKAVATGANPIELKRGMDAALTEIVAALSQSSIPVKDLTHIHQVATISANNDESMGALITQCMEAVGFDGIITVEQSKSAETYVDIVEGMQFKSGYLSPYFINSNEKPQVEFENALILLVDGKVSVLNDIVQFLEYSNQKGRPLLVISESVDGDALNTMVLNKLRGTIKAAAVRAPGFGELRKENLDDIAILTGAKTISEREGYSLAETIASEVLGSATKVIVTADSTTIIGGEGSQDSIKERISDINAQIENSTNESATLILKERLARLDGGVAIIITRADKAKDCKQTPVQILGAEYSMLFNHEIISDFYQGDLIRTENSEIVADRLAAAAGIAPKDTDVAMIYDNFTPQVLRQLEGFKYCGIGEANDYIKDGNLELDGKTPLSPNGGLMGEGYIHGMNNITEGVRQMRGTAANQIRNAKTAMLASGVAGAIIGV